MSRFLPNLFGDTSNQDEQPEPPITRSRAAAASLSVPPSTSSVGRGKPRSRTPSPLPPGSGQQFFPTASSAPDQFDMPDNEALRILAETAAASAAAQASAQTATALQNLNIGSKKPELPAFDSKHIDIWIRRTEAAYIRAGIRTAKEKFAFLEAKIAVDFDPRINEFLYGDPSEENWTSFLAYLKTTYGRTRRQEAASILDGTRRDGRRPTQLLSKIKEKAGSATMDDVFKELIMRELPQSVRHSLVDQVDTMTASEMANLADRYFDQEGRLLNPQSSVSHIDASDEALPQPDEPHGPSDTDVNALGARPKNRFPPRQPPKTFTPAFGGPPPNNNGPRSNFNQKAAPAQKHSFSNKAKSSLKSVCHRHMKFGEEAKYCEPGCSYWPKMQAGNGAAGWRK